MTTAGAAPGFVLCEPFVAVLIVNFAGFFVRKGFVGFGYLDEALRSGVITTIAYVSAFEEVHDRARIVTDGFLSG